MILCTSRVMIMKEQQPFCRETNTLCIEEREAALKDSAF